jgi:replicative DNA helicase
MNAHDPSIHTVPVNIEAEQAVLGALLLNNAAMDRIGDLLEADHFHDQLHRAVFEAIRKMIAMGKTANPVTIKGALPDTFKGLKIEGEDATVMEYVALLCAKAINVINARDYAEAVHEMWIRRHAISAVNDVMDIAFNLPPDRDILDELEPIESKITALRAERIRGANKKGIGQAYLDSLTEARQRGSVRGVPICLEEIRIVISEPCFEATNLYGLLSSSGEGKTSLTLQIIAHALEEGHPVQFQSYDQSQEQCVRQMVAQKFGIEARRQRSATWQTKSGKRLSTTPTGLIASHSRS